MSEFPLECSCSNTHRAVAPGSWVLVQGAHSVFGGFHRVQSWQCGAVVGSPVSGAGSEVRIQLPHYLAVQTGPVSEPLVAPLLIYWNEDMGIVRRINWADLWQRLEQCLLHTEVRERSSAVIQLLLSASYFSSFGSIIAWFLKIELKKSSWSLLSLLID